MRILPTDAEIARRIQTEEIPTKLLADLADDPSRPNPVSLGVAEAEHTTQADKEAITPD